MLIPQSATTCTFSETRQSRAVFESVTKIFLKHGLVNAQSMREYKLELREEYLSPH